METKEKELTPEQELFCIAYTRAETDTFSNATTSYAEAYRYDLASLNNEREIDSNKKEIIGSSEREKAYHYCQIAGSRLMLNDVIKDRIKALLMKLFNDDDISDAKLQTIIIRGKDADAINAIKHRSDLKQRITKKLDITTGNRPFASLSDDELLKLAGGEA